MAENESSDVLFRFNPTGETFEMSGRYLLPELLWVQKNLGVDVAEVGAGTRMFISMFLILRRSDPRRWNAKTFESLSTDDFDIIETEPADETAEDGTTEEGEYVDPTAGSAPDPETAPVTTN